MAIVEDIEKRWLQSLQFNRWGTQVNMTNHSYVARPRETNIAMKAKENHREN